MLICVYDTANEAEILKAKITQIATADIEELPTGYVRGMRAL